MQAADNLLLILHEVPEADEVSRRGILYWRDGSGQWKASDGSPASCLQQHLQRYAKRLEEFDQLEHAAQSADEYSRLLEGLAPIARSVRNLLETSRRSAESYPQRSQFNRSPRPRL